jgi:hypothetical protein
MKQCVIINFSADYKVPEELAKLTLRESEILVEAGLNAIKNSKQMAHQVSNEDLLKDIQEAHQKEMMMLKAEMMAIEKTNKIMSEREQGFYLKQIEATKQACEAQMRAMETEILKKKLWTVVFARIFFIG